MRIALIGSSGEIGSRLAVHLIKNNFDVHLFSRNPCLRALRFEQANFSRIDLQDKNMLHSSLRDIDCIINCAIDKQTYQTEDEAVEKNKVATINLMEAARRNGVKKFIELSSMAVLPPKITQQTIEKPFTYSSETDWYTRAKIENEKVVMSFKDNMQVSIIRAGVVYGPYLHWSKLAFMRTQSKIVVLPDVPSSICHAIHIDDLIGLIIHSIHEEDTRELKLIYGINPELISWRDYYDGHGQQITFNQKTTELASIEEIDLMNRIDGDELRRPGLKRTIIDTGRRITNKTPKYIKKSPFLRKLIYRLKAMNYGLINYDSYIASTEMKQLQKVFPNRFELELYQTEFMPHQNSDYKYQISFAEGVKSAANWWLYSTEK